MKVGLKVREGGVVSPARRQLLSALRQTLFTMSLYRVKVPLKVRADAALSPIYALKAIHAQESKKASRDKAKAVVAELRHEAEGGCQEGRGRYRGNADLLRFSQRALDAHPYQQRD